MSFEQYEHHGEVVWVGSELKGKHRDHCLCFSCEKFLPGDENNCPKAQKLFNLCVEENMVTPVYECPEFEAKT